MNFDKILHFLSTKYCIINSQQTQQVVVFCRTKKKKGVFPVQKKLNLVILAVKMIFLGYIIDALNYLVWKSAVSKRRKSYRLLSFMDNAIGRFRDEFGRIETVFLLSCEPIHIAEIIKE